MDINTGLEPLTWQVKSLFVKGEFETLEKSPLPPFNKRGGEKYLFFPGHLSYETHH
jgi:hypothetical protein